MQPFKKIARNWRSSKLFHTATGSVIAWQTSHARHLVVLSYPDCPRIAPRYENENTLRTKVRRRGYMCRSGRARRPAEPRGEGGANPLGKPGMSRLAEDGSSHQFNACFVREARVPDVPETSRNRFSRLKPAGGWGIIIAFCPPMGGTIDFPRGRAAKKSNRRRVWEHKKGYKVKCQKSQDSMVLW